MATVFKSVLSPKTWLTLRRISILIAGSAMQMTFGAAAYTFGNMNPYMTSYMRKTGSAPTLTYTECSWVYVASLCTQAAVMPVAGHLARRLGNKRTCLLGCLIFSAGVALSYFSIQHSFGALVFTYGIVFGFGVGLCYMIPMTIAMQWMPHNPGLATGIVNGGAGGGALIFTMIQTSFINPENKEVQLQVGEERYFDQDDVLDRVPDVLPVLAAIYAVMQLVAILLLAEPPEEMHIMIDLDLEFRAQNKEHSKLPVVENDVTEPLLGKRGSTKMTPKPSEEEDEGFSPREAMKTLDFYLIFFIFVFNGLGVVFLNSLYKAFGLSFINDDVFLSSVGTLSSVFNFFGRVFWGSMGDLLSFRVATMMMCTLFTALVLTLQVTVYTHKYLFMAYICVLIGTGAGTFTLIPTVMAKRFGKKHVTTNYGIIFLSQLITAPMTVLISQTLLTKLGWTGLFFVIAALYYAGFILAFMFRAKNKNGKDM